MPALIQLLGASPGGGFSTNSVTRPCGSVSSGTTPYRDGSSTSVRATVPSAPEVSWRAQRSVTSRSVSTSPLTTRNLPSMLAASAANRTAPAVSSGSGSTA